MTLKFRVYGIAQPKGSTKAYTYRLQQKDGRMARDQYGDPVYRAAVTSDNPKHKDWQKLVAQAARAAIQSLPPEARTITLGPVAVTMWCYLPRPKKYIRPKFGAGPAHITKPDSSKLARAVEDALIHVVWRDDAQITDLTVHKRYVPMDAGRLEAPYLDVLVEPSATFDAGVPREVPTTAPPARPLFPDLDTPRGGYD